MGLKLATLGSAWRAIATLIFRRSWVMIRTDRLDGRVGESLFNHDREACLGRDGTRLAAASVRYVVGAGISVVAMMKS